MGPWTEVDTLSHQLRVAVKNVHPKVGSCIIRFLGGPPYEDVAFKIVNKEWEYSHKHGFKCSFDRGILHLFFNFKRSRYRK